MAGPNKTLIPKKSMQDLNPGKLKIPVNQNLMNGKINNLLNEQDKIDLTKQMENNQKSKMKSFQI